jgi:hypothetical protein
VKGLIRKFFSFVCGKSLGGHIWSNLTTYHRPTIIRWTGETETDRDIKQVCVFCKRGRLIRVVTVKDDGGHDRMITTWEK